MENCNFFIACFSWEVLLVGDGDWWLSLKHIMMVPMQFQTDIKWAKNVHDILVFIQLKGDYVIEMSVKLM